MTALAHPDQLITAAELEPLLGSDGLRVYDCTTYLIYETGTGRPYTVKSGAEDYAAGHIPGTINIPYGDDFVGWAGWLVHYDAPFYLIADSGLIEAAAREYFAGGG